VFRTISGPPSQWESLLPPQLLRLPEELARVDALLDDSVFFAPFAPYFHPVLGRPSTPIECYLRLMYLKFRYRLGYESLCAADHGQMAALDDIDFRILAALRADGRLSMRALAEKLHISRANAYTRVERLESSRVITGSTATINPPRAVGTACPPTSSSRSPSSRGRRSAARCSAFPKLTTPRWYRASTTSCCWFARGTQPRCAMWS